MISLEGIRKKTGLVLLVIGFGMGAFILMDLMSASGSGRGVSNVVLEVFGDEHDIKELQSRVTDATKNQQNANKSSSEIRETEFNAFKRQKIFENQFSKLSITTSKEERNDMIYGDNVHPVISQAQIFINPETNLFDKQLVVQYLNNIKQDNTGKAELTWINFEQQIKYSRKEQKYNTMLFQSSYITENFASSTYKNQNEFRDISYVSIPIKSIPDSFINISNSEIKNYLNDNSEEYNQESSRSFSYVIFDIIPSKEDSSYSKIYLNNLKDDWFDLGLEDSLNLSFVNQYSGNSKSEFIYMSNDDLDKKFNIIHSDRSSVSNSDILGPYINRDGYELLKIIDDNWTPDSVKVAVIFRNIVYSTQTRKKFFAEAGAFCTNNNNKKDFNESIIDLGLTKRIKEDMRKEEKFIVGLDDPNDIITWVNQAQEGDISDVFPLENKFVVVCLDIVKDAGTKSLTEVENEIKSIIIKQKKANIIMNEINSINYMSLSEVIDVFGGEIKEIKKISFYDSQLPGLGEEFSLIGSVFAIDQGVLTNAVHGKNNIYVATVDSIITPIDNNFTGVLNQLKIDIRNRSIYDSYIALEDVSNLVDNRIKLNYY